MIQAKYFMKSLASISSCQTEQLLRDRISARRERDNPNPISRSQFVIHL